MRGYQQPYQPRLLVLIDGRQVFIDDYSRMDWANLPVNIDDIKQIEVVKGTSSALFGSNATGGVINIITNSPIYDKNNVASVTLGTQSMLTEDATSTFGLGDVGGIKISAGGLDVHEFNTSRSSYEQQYEVVRPYHYYANQNSVFSAGNNIQFNTEASFSDKNNEQATLTYGLSPLRATSYSLGAGVDWQTPYGLIKNTNYINHYFFNADTAGDIRETTDLVVSQLEDQIKISDNHTVRALLEYRYKDFNVEDASAPVFEKPQQTENNIALAGTWMYRMSEKLSATNALRFEQVSMNTGGTFLPICYIPQNAYNQSYNTISANSGLNYLATDLDTFRVTYGRGVQNPSQIETAFNINFPSGQGFNENVIGNPNLKPTIVDNYEVGYDRKINDIFSIARFSAYYEFNHDLINYNLDGSLGSNQYGVIAESLNVGNSQGAGGEIEIKGHHPSGIRWDTSYSYQTIRDATLVAETLGYARSSPEHHIRLLLGYTTGKWEFDTNGQYVTSTNMLRTPNPAIPQTQAMTSGYTSLSGRVGYHVTDAVSVAASAFNINHDHFAASAYPALERQALLTLTARF